MRLYYNSKNPWFISKLECPVAALFKQLNRAKFAPNGRNPVTLRPRNKKFHLHFFSCRDLLLEKKYYPYNRSFFFEIKFTNHYNNNHLLRIYFS